VTHEATSDNPYTRGIAEFVSGLTYEAIPEEVRHRIKLLMLDSLGCALYGADLEWCRILQDSLAKVDATRECVIWGTKQKLSAPHAALANGTAVQGFELDDVHRAGVLHVGAVVLPALIAIAETRPGMSGREFLTAAVAGYEIGPRVGLCMGPEHIAQGWHSGATLGVELREERGDLELVGEVERRGRFVEQEISRFRFRAFAFRLMAGLRVELRERRRDHDALLLAAAERRERPVLQRERAGGRERLVHDRDVARPFDLERCQRLRQPAGRLVDRRCQLAVVGCHRKLRELRGDRRRRVDEKAGVGGAEIVVHGRPEDGVARFAVAPVGRSGLAAGEGDARGARARRTARNRTRRHPGQVCARGHARRGSEIGCRAVIGDVDARVRHAVVVGRSNIVGKPMALLLLQRGATVTICNSRTPDLGEMTRQADILVVAAGKPMLVTSGMVKQGAVVIDVGINRLADGKLSGDVDFQSVWGTASRISPVPGGVGPMTIAMLIENTLLAAERVAPHADP